MKKIIVFLPALNEENNIGKVIQSVPKKIGPAKVEVLVVDDGSVDKTSEVARRCGALVVRHEGNMGVGRAFQTGLEKTLSLGADYLVNIDADGQFSPSEIIKLMSPILEDKADFVASDRFLGSDGKLRKPANMPSDKYYGNLMMSKLVSFLAGKKFNDVSCGFRAYNKVAMLSLNLTGKFTYTQESFLDLAVKGLRIVTVPVSVKYFSDRKSRVAGNIFVYAIKTSKIIFRTSRDYRPMLFFFYVSMLPFLVSVVCGVFLANHYFTTGALTPYKYVGFVCLYTSTLAMQLLIMGFVADMFTRQRLYLEKILLFSKYSYYGNKP